MGTLPLHDPATPPSTKPVTRVGGKEELRANLLKPYLLRLRSVKDDAAVRALMSVAGIPLSVIDDETGWISVVAGSLTIEAIESSLGAGVLTPLDLWLTHPENLGTYRRMRATAAKRTHA